MITDVPLPSDFQQAGIGFLNLAWDSAYELVGHSRNFEDADYWGDEERDFWNAAQRPLATALALAQQGIELLLKAKIAEVSPYLLLDGNWCKGHDKANTPFSDFRTIDSQDLIRAHDAVQSNHLPDDFKNRVNDLRKLRNSIFHTVDKRLRVTARDVLFSILDAVHYLVGPRQWLAIRRASYTASPVYLAYIGADEWQDGALAQEAALIMEVFPPADVFRFVGVNKKQRRYLCYDCHRSCVEFHDPLACRFAVLRPNTAASTALFCVVCDTETSVNRVSCNESGCKGNVIHAEDEVCLTCFKDQT